MAKSDDSIGTCGNLNLSLYDIHLCRYPIIRKSDTYFWTICVDIIMTYTSMKDIHDLMNVFLRNLKVELLVIVVLCVCSFQRLPFCVVRQQSNTEGLDTL